MKEALLEKAWCNLIKKNEKTIILPFIMEINSKIIDKQEPLREVFYYEP